MLDNYIFESKKELRTEMKIEEDELPQDNFVISATEGNSIHHYVAANDSIEPLEHNDSMNDQLEDEHLLDFLKGLDFPDMNIYFGSRSFGVHKFKMAKSPIFKRKIYNNEEIKISKGDFKAAIETLRFLYKEEIPLYKLLDPIAALSGGIKFQVEGLKELSESCLNEIQLTDNLACVLYQNYDGLSANFTCKIEDYMFRNIDTIWKRIYESTVKRPDLLCKLIKAALLKKPENVVM